jgi:N-methylhydantoinase A/oxoprolinase/acetone carboxylase beta subunit
MAFRVGIDTGGTYTDAVLVDAEAQVLAAAKALTTPHDLSIGVTEALLQVISGRAAEVGLVCVSTTLATNALVERRWGSVALLLFGYRSGAMQRSGLEDALAGDPVYFLPGGHDAHGDPLTELDESSVRALVRRLAPGVAGFAVSALFSVRNPVHEECVRRWIREECDRPVTCGHELSAHLDAPRRALTTLLNARLIPTLSGLITSVQSTLERHEVSAPLMVVKGDGSLMNAQTALERPVETILSGPAASVLGARHLSGERNAVVADMGGTTLDVAVLAEGVPELAPDGASVGGWRTMVEAIQVYTHGLGGDSEIREGAFRCFAFGPRRVEPLSLLAHRHPHVLDLLEAVLEQFGADSRDAGFALIRDRDVVKRELSSGQRQVLELLSDGPLMLRTLLQDAALQYPLDKLVERGAVALAGLTPSDLAHVLGTQNQWCQAAAVAGVEVWRMRLQRVWGWRWDSAAAFARDVLAQMSGAGGFAVISSVVNEVSAANRPPLGTDAVLRWVMDDTRAGLLDWQPRLRQPLVGVGGPADTHLPAVAERLATTCIVPRHAAVANAVGATVGGVMRRITVLISALEYGVYRVHGPESVSTHTDLEQALAVASKQAVASARAQAERAGADAIEVKVEREDTRAYGDDGTELFIETTVRATALGQPRILSPDSGSRDSMAVS